MRVRPERHPPASADSSSGRLARTVRGPADSPRRATPRNSPRRVCAEAFRDEPGHRGVQGEPGRPRAVECVGPHPSKPSAVMSFAVMRTVGPSCSTVPSTNCVTPSCRAISGIEVGLPLNESAEARPTTLSPGPRVHGTLRNDFGPSASRSFGSSIPTGSRNGAPSAIACVRCAASFHSIRKCPSSRACAAPPPRLATRSCGRRLGWRIRTWRGGSGREVARSSARGENAPLAGGCIVPRSTRKGRFAVFAQTHGQESPWPVAGAFQPRSGAGPEWGDAPGPRPADPRFREFDRGRSRLQHVHVVDGSSSRWWHNKTAEL